MGVEGVMGGRLVAASRPGRGRFGGHCGIALEQGGTCEGKPGDRGGGFYAAYFRDLDGNKICAFCDAINA